MATRPREFINDGVYHIYNRGVEKRTIFSRASDKRRFLETLLFYQQIDETLRRYSRTKFSAAERQPPYRFDIIAFCLMDNHFHLMLKQSQDYGITTGIGLLLNSYTRYFNTRYDRVGHLFQGRFQAVAVKDDEQYLHLARYIMLNPLVAGYVSDFSIYPWSSAGEYFIDRAENICTHERLLAHFSNDYASAEKFITDHIDYAEQLEIIKHFPGVI